MKIFGSISEPPIGLRRKVHNSSAHPSPSPHMCRDLPMHHTSAKRVSSQSPADLVQLHHRATIAPGLKKRVVQIRLPLAPSVPPMHSRSPNKASIISRVAPLIVAAVAFQCESCKVRNPHQVQRLPRWNGRDRHCPIDATIEESSITYGTEHVQWPDCADNYMQDYCENIQPSARSKLIVKTFTALS
jgi:hypothetical protein